MAAPYNWTPEQGQQLLQFQERYVKKLKCRVCESQDWMMAESFVKMTEISEMLGRQGEAESYPKYLQAICKKCGLTEFFYANIAGVDTRDIP